MILFSQSFLFLFFFNGILAIYLEDFEINANNYYLFYFIFMLYLNATLNDSERKLSINVDLIFKFLVFLARTPNFFLNYFINIIKKIYIYLIFFKYRNFINTIFIFFKSFSKNLFLVWRPLFKKTSYFGFFRSNRSKWIK